MIWQLACHFTTKLAVRSVFVAHSMLAGVRWLHLVGMQIRRQLGTPARQSHETRFPRGLAVSHGAHTDPPEAIFFPFPATVGEVK